MRGEQVEWGRQEKSKRWDMSTRGQIEYYRGKKEQQLTQADSFACTPSQETLNRRDDDVKWKMWDYETTGHWATDTEPIMWPKEFLESLFEFPLRANNHEVWVGIDADDDFEIENPKGDHVL